MVEPLKIYHCLSLCKNTYRKDLSFNKKTFSILIQIESLYIKEKMQCITNKSLETISKVHVSVLVMKITY